MHARTHTRARARTHTHTHTHTHTQTYTLVAVTVLFSCQTFPLVYSCIYTLEILRWAQFTGESFLSSLRICYLVSLHQG